MVIMVYKSSDERDADAQIVKYSDDIWFSHDGSARCLRSMIIHVLQGSPMALSKVSLVIPLPAKQITQIADKSETCLSEDFWLNRPEYQAGGYKVKDTKLGTIFNDNFDDVTVRFPNTFEPLVSIGSASILTINLAEPVKAGELREVRFAFSASSVAKFYEEDNYYVDLLYFGSSTVDYDHRKEIDHLRSNEQIPVKPIYNLDIDQGGFDVILYLPPGMIGDFPMRKSPTRLANEEGTEGEVREKYMWEMHPATDASLVTLGANFLVGGWWRPSVRRPVIEQLRFVGISVSAVRQRVDRLSSQGKWALGIGIAGLVFAIAALVISLALR